MVLRILDLQSTHYQYETQKVATENDGEGDCVFLLLRAHHLANLGALFIESCVGMLSAIHQILQTHHGSLQLFFEFFFIVFQLQTIIFNIFEHLNWDQNGIINSLINLIQDGSLFFHGVICLTTLI